MFRNHCFTERFRSQVCDIFFAPYSAHSQSLRSDLVLYPQERHSLCASTSRFPANGECAQWLLRQWPALVSLQSPNHTGFTAKPKSHIMLWTPFASDASNVAAYSSASALLFAMTFCFPVYVFRVCLPSTSTRALDDSRVSLQPAQSESMNTVSSSAIFPYSNTCPHCLSRLSLSSLARLC